jgi:hypothetical protein
MAMIYLSEWNGDDLANGLLEDRCHARTGVISLQAVDPSLNGQSGTVMSGSAVIGLIIVA